MATRRKAPARPRRPTPAQVRRLRQLLDRIEKTHRQLHLHLRQVRRQLEGPFMFLP